MKKHYGKCHKHKVKQRKENSSDLNSLLLHFKVVAIFPYVNRKIYVVSRSANSYKYAINFN